MLRSRWQCFGIMCSQLYRGFWDLRIIPTCSWGRGRLAGEVAEEEEEGDGRNRSLAMLQQTVTSAWGRSAWTKTYASTKTCQWGARRKVREVRNRGGSGSSELTAIAFGACRSLRHCKLCCELLGGDVEQLSRGKCRGEGGLLIATKASKKRPRINAIEGGGMAH
jgi:hypothetical protein